MSIQILKCGVLFALCSGAVSFSGASAAQSDPSKAAATGAPVNVRLHLVQKDDSPVIGAEVSVKGDKIARTSRSDRGGIVAVEGLTPGSIEIRVRRIGFRQSQFLARVATGDNAFTITVHGSSVTLDELRIVGNRSVVGRLEDFDMRTKRGDASAV